MERARLVPEATAHTAEEMERESEKERKIRADKEEGQESGEGRQPKQPQLPPRLPKPLPGSAQHEPSTEGNTRSAQLLVTHSWSEDDESLGIRVVQNIDCPGVIVKRVLNQELYGQYP